MTTFTWIVQILLALIFSMAGSMKLASDKKTLIKKGMGFAEALQPGTLKIIGTLELLGAIGIILPEAINIIPILTPIAAIGLALLMIGAMAVHGKRKEFQFWLVNIILLAGAIFVAVQLW